MSQSTPFTEVQKFRQIWIWLSFVASAVALGFLYTQVFASNPILQEQSTKLILLLAALVYFAILWLISKVGLTTTFDTYGLTYRFVPFHRKEYHVNWTDVQEVYVATFNQLSEYQGWGIKKDLHEKGTYYTTRGKHGVYLRLTDGTIMMFGTQKPDEIMAWLQANGLSQT